MKTKLLLRFHWWCMRRAAYYDRPGYSLRSFAFDWLGGRAADLLIRHRLREAIRAAGPS